MVISTQLRRKSDPNTLQQVLVYIDDLKIKFDIALDSASTMVQLRIRVQSDTNADNTDDSPDTPWSTFDVPKIFYATGAQLAAVDNRLRGSGNLMQAIRTFCKARVDEHNDEILPGGSTATHVDLDNDNPS